MLIPIFYSPCYTPLMAENTTVSSKFHIGDWIQYNDGIYHISYICLNEALNEHVYVIERPNISISVPLSEADRVFIKK